MFDLTIDPTRHSAALAEGRTRFPLAEVEAVAAELLAAEADFETAVLEADKALKPFERPYPFWHAHLTGEAAALWNLLEDQPSRDLGGHNYTEAYPLRKWQKMARQHRRFAARLRAQLAKVAAVAA